MDPLTQAIALNLWIGFSYVAAAAAVALFLITYGSGAVRWVGESRWAYFLLFGGGLSAMVFLLGCGFHHLHIAAHALTGHPLASQTTFHGLLFNWMQAIAAPGWVAFTWGLYLIISRKLRDA